MSAQDKWRIERVHEINPHIREAGDTLHIGWDITVIDKPFKVTWKWRIKTTLKDYRDRIAFAIYVLRRGVPNY